MTKAALCVHCSDIVAPRRAWRTDRSWRWCECEHMAVRWRDGSRGLLEVTALHGPEAVRVIGLNNAFLGAACVALDDEGRGRTEEQWRALHDWACAQVEHTYLFHRDRRACWALVVRVGESGDVTFVDYASVIAEARTAASGQSGSQAASSQTGQIANRSD